MADIARVDLVGRGLVGPASPKSGPACLVDTHRGVRWGHYPPWTGPGLHFWGPLIVLATRRPRPCPHCPLCPPAERPPPRGTDSGR
jgi:hypothetical protein